MKSYFPIILALLFSNAGASFADPADGQEKPEDNPKGSVMDRLKSIDEVDPRDWGIRNGCISLNRVRSINFKDDQTAILKLRARKKAILRLRRECHGIESNGFVHHSRSDQLCARFDSLRVLRSGHSCQIESIEPFVELEEAEVEDAEPKKRKKDKDSSK